MTSSPADKSNAKRGDVDTAVIYCGDNIDPLRRQPDASIHLIYIDPPFNSNRNYEVFWGEAKEKRYFEDRHESIRAYIDFMRPRCMEIWRVLKDTGSFFYHCDWHASHYVKVMLDQIFGESNFRNEVVWCYTGPGSPGMVQSFEDFVYQKITSWACRVMAQRLKDVCKLPESEKQWERGRGFVVRDLPWTEAELRKIPPFEFENWAVIALGGVPNKAQVGDMGIDGRIYPVAKMPVRSGQRAGELDFMDIWYPVQVKQKDKAGWPDIDSFEAAMLRENRTKGFFVSFEFSADALREIDSFFRREHRVIVPLTVREILDETLAQRLA